MTLSLGDALCELCWFTYLAGDLPAALAMIDEAVALARSAGNPHLLATALSNRAAFKGDAGELARPQPTSRRSSRWRERPETTTYSSPPW